MKKHRPKLLDLFCGAGGAGEGYRRAGFEVTGVDLYPQPRNPHEFIQADAMKLPIDFLMQFDVIHASPPCQAYSVLAKRTGVGHRWPKLIERVRDMLAKTNKLTVIENVQGAPLIDPVILCGTMFPGLRVLRHRLFEVNFPVTPPEHRPHPLVHTVDKRKNHYGKTDEWKDFVSVNGGANCSVAAARDAMKIDWMTKAELNQSIPPAYTQFLGKAIMQELKKTQVKDAA